MIEIPGGCHFTLQNIPFGVFSLVNGGGEGRLRIGTAIGEYAVEIVCLPLKCLEENSSLKQALKQATLNDFMAMGRPVWRQLRLELQAYFESLTGPIDGFHPLKSIKMHLPISVGDYTDFYASKEHASNVGEMFRGKDNALMPNWLHLPVGYHGRASSIVVSGTPIKRPLGQCKPNPQEDPILKPSSKLDFELEMGFIIGVGNDLGTSIPIDQANEHIFGVCLLNDWSARDIQAWEYVPLGPFLGKNFGTTISPWIVTLDALEPFLVDGPSQVPKPLPYLFSDAPSNYDISLEVKINDSMVCKSNLKYLYWSFAQQLAHHTVNGCNMRAGDICGTGTISGPVKESFGSLLELSWNGSQPITLADGSTRTFLQDGDTVSMTAFCVGKDDGIIQVGFGECSGKVLGCD